MWKVSELTCEYKKNPLGLDVAHPRFGWKMISDARGAKQTAYQLQVGLEPSFERQVLWDTGKTETDQSIHVVYEGPVLAARKRYWHRVRAWNEKQEMSEWSGPAFWETGLLSADSWQAEWITAKLPESRTEEDPGHYLRRSVMLRGKPASARIYASSHGMYRLFVNGSEADDTRLAPGWTSYRNRLQYQSYDVTGLLSEGDNVLGVMLGNGWFMGNVGWKDQRNFYGSERALLLQMHVQYPDGSEEVIVSGDHGDWRASDGPLRYSEIYHGEIYEAARELEGWKRPGFDDSAWLPVEKRDHSKSNLIAQENEPVRVMQQLQPVEVITTPRGEMVLDLGQNMVGWMRFTVKEAAGTAIRLQHAEVLDREGNFYTGNLRSAKQTITYICRGGGEETYEPYFSFQGFRYVKIEGLKAEGLAEKFTGCVIHSDLPAAGSFETSDALLNRLYQNIVWGQKGNFVDVPTDCPQRDERLGWTGDAQVFVRTSTYQMNVASFFTKWLRDLAAEQLPEGGVPYVIPHVLDAGSHSSAAWGDAAVICPWVLYEVYGDKRILEQQYDSMKMWVEYIRSQGSEEFLWNTGFHFGDWLALDGKEGSYIGQTPKDLIATAYYAYSAKIVAKTAAILGKTADAAFYEDLHGNVVAHFRREFVSPNGRVIAPTQTAYVLALMFDLLEEPHRDQAAARLASYIEEAGDKLTTGFVGTPYLCPVLSRFGYHELAYRLVMQKEYPSWLYSVTQGATTIWEHWDGIKPDGTFWSDDMNSYNHYAYGSVGEWLFRVAAGIDTAEGIPAYKRFRIAPVFGGNLTYVRATHETMYGTIKVRWERKPDGAIVVDASVPPNTQAAVVLPGAVRNRLMESGRELKDSEGVGAVSWTKAGVELEVGSGEYRFEF